MPFFAIMLMQQPCPTRRSPASPFIVLSANSNKIRTAVHEAREKQIICVDFTNTMTGGTYLEQLENTKKTPEENLTYYGAVFFGPWTDVSELTKKFSLWK